MTGKTINFTRRQIDWLITHTENRELSKKYLYANDLNKNSEKNYHSFFQIYFTNSEIETSLDELTYLLVLIGVDENSEVNNEGLIIEDLIDLFSS